MALKKSFFVEEEKKAGKITYYVKSGISKKQYKEILINNSLTKSDIFKVLMNLKREEEFDTKLINDNYSLIADFSKNTSKYLNINIKTLKKLNFQPEILIFFNVHITSNNRVVYKAKHFFYDELEAFVKNFKSLPPRLQSLTKNVVLPKEEPKIKNKKSSNLTNNNIKDIKNKNNETIKKLPIKKSIYNNFTLPMLEKILLSKENQLKLIDNKINELEQKPKEKMDDELLLKINNLEQNINNLTTLANNLRDEISRSEYEDKRGMYLKLNDVNMQLENAQKEYEEKFQIYSRQQTIFLSDELAIKISKFKTIKHILSEEIKNISEEITKHKKNTIDSFIPSVKINSNYVFSTNITIIKNIYGITNSRSQYKSLYAVYYNMLTRGTVVSHSKILNNKDKEFKTKVYQLQMLILLLVREGKLDDEKWIFSISDEYKTHLEFAYNETIYWVSELSKLTNLKYKKPEILINNNEDGVKVYFNFGPSIDYNTYIIESKLDDYTIEDELGIWVEEQIKYNIKNRQIHINVLENIMNYLFGFNEFREGQFEIIRNFLNGNSTIGLLTTGGGKSLTYYLSVLLQPKISLVIAPINSLIKDQTDKLKDTFGINKVGILTSDNEDMHNDLKRFSRAQTLFTFASPERAQNINFRNILINLNHNQTIGTIVLDEVHCLSEWGHDFRIPYLMLSTTLNTYCDGIKYLGLTATASINVIRDLMIELNIKTENIIFTKKLKRDNLNFKIKKFHSSEAALESLTSKLQQNYYSNSDLDFNKSRLEKNSIIIFSRTVSGPNGVKSIHNKLSKHFINHVASYYGEKKDEQDDFMDDNKTILVATKAFGMGIDKPNIRLAAHFGMPESRESYYQEAGRAGRDNKDSECILYSFTSFDKNNLVNEFFDPNTSLERAQEIQEELKGTDIATNFYFHLNNIEKIEDEVTKTLIYYEQLSNNKNLQYVFTSTEKYDNTEKYLYILHKMGIINNWTVEYIGRSFSNKKYQVDINTNYKNIEHIKKTSLTYINVYSEKNEYTYLSHDAQYQESINNVESIDQLGNIVLTMRKWYHDTFIQTRRIQLENMFRLVNDSHNKNIQEILESAFNISEILSGADEGYSLTFDENTIEEVITFGFDLAEDKLLERRFRMEHLLESVTSLKVQLYLSILILRLNEFNKDNNGRQRFNYILNELNEEEKQDIMFAIKNNYQKIQMNHKLELFNSLYKADQVMFKQMLNMLEQDDLVKYTMQTLMLPKLRKRW